MKDYQLLVIGAGPGGYTAALHAASLGLRTAVVEKAQAGGTCLNRGCVPTKALLHASGLYNEIRHGASAGIIADAVRPDLAAMFARKREITQKLSSGILSMFRSAKVDWIPGTAVIQAPGTVLVRGGDGADGEESADGEQTLHARDILIATGSVPARPPIPGLDLPGVLTSDELLEGADHLYRSIVIIGGGVIGVELATFYNDLGSQVTIVEGLDRLLPNMDRELGQSLAQLMKRRGVAIHTGAMVERVERQTDGLCVHFAAKGGPARATGETVLCAIGRRPYWEGLFAENLRPQTDGRSLRVDARYQTSIPHVYAVGDVSSQVQLAHVASAQGVRCVDLLCGRENAVAMDVIPSCVYCRPEIASVGMSEQAAKDAGIAVRVGKCTLFSNARNLILDGDRSFLKLVARADDHRLIGAHLMCQNSTDMISQLSVAIANGMRAEQLCKAMRPHPTFEEALGDALDDLMKKL